MWMDCKKKGWGCYVLALFLYSREALHKKSRLYKNYKRLLELLKALQLRGAVSERWSATPRST